LEHLEEKKVKGGGGGVWSRSRTTRRTSDHATDAVLF
jgi:hypothetical protein